MTGASDPGCTISPDCTDTLPWNVFQPNPEPPIPEVVDLATPERPSKIKQECLDDEAPAQPNIPASIAEAAPPSEPLPLMETEMPEPKPTNLLYENDLTPEKNAP